MKPSTSELLMVLVQDLSLRIAPALDDTYLQSNAQLWAVLCLLAHQEQARAADARIKDIRSLIQKGTVRDGMIPKLRSCARTIQHGVHEIDIISPDTQNSLLRTVIKRESVGTRIVKSK